MLTPEVFGAYRIVIIEIFSYLAPVSIVALIVALWRRHPRHPYLLMTIAVSTLAWLDAPMNWATFAAYNPDLWHWPEGWPIVSLYPTIEPLFIAAIAMFVVPTFFPGDLASAAAASAPPESTQPKRPPIGGNSTGRPSMRSCCAERMFAIVLTLRFDMRVPDWVGPAAAHYSAMLDMCEWAETRGAALAVLSEHHGASDGHLPTPLILASAVAARTQEMAILLAAVPLPLRDPVRLAEEISVLDLISGGRVSYAFGVGHREEEYTHFGVEMATRGRLADEYLGVLIRLVRGESVDFRGRQVRVTPRCTSPNGPPMMIAGGSKAAVRRAAAHGLGFISQIDRPELRSYYEDQCRRLGTVPGFVQFPVPDSPTAVFVGDDVDQAWEQLGPHLLHDAAMAAAYRHGDDSVASITRAQTVAELRLAGGPYSILTPAAATEFVRAGKSLPLHPLCGGIDPELAWRYLQTAVAAHQQAQMVHG